MNLEFPLEITTLLNGKKIQAIIFESIEGSENTGFRVRFENGFEDDFFLAGNDGSLGPVGKKIGWPPYGAALQPDLLIISQLGEGQLYEIFRHKIEGVTANIWVTKEWPDDGRNYFYVYHNQYCRFKFDRNPETGNWRMLNNYSGETDTNLDLVRIAGSVMEAKESKMSISIM